MTIFSKIINKEVPAKIVYEDDVCLAFRDVSPQAPCHILMIPKIPIRSLDEVTLQDQNVLGHMMIQISKIAKNEGISESGYRVVTNIGDQGGQSVPHLHFHILGGRALTWPPG